MAGAIPGGQPDAAEAAVSSGRASLRRLRRATFLAPTALLLVVVGPSVAAAEAVPLPTALGQPLLAGLGALAALAAIQQADACDDLQRVADQNLRLLLLMVAMVSIAVAGAWLWLGGMNLLQWVLAAV